MESVLETILTGNALVEWQGIDKHTAKSANVKDVLRGIPTKAFWLFYKANKDVLKALGVTLWASRQKIVTGEYKTHKGRSRAVAKKQWEVSVWLNRLNRPVLAEAGFTVYEDSQQIEGDN